MSTQCGSADTACEALRNAVEPDMLDTLKPLFVFLKADSYSLAGKPPAVVNAMANAMADAFKAINDGTSSISDTASLDRWVGNWLSSASNMAGGDKTFVAEQQAMYGRIDTTAIDSSKDIYFVKAVRHICKVCFILLWLTSLVSSSPDNFNAFNSIPHTHITGSSTMLPGSNNESQQAAMRSMSAASKDIRSDQDKLSSDVRGHGILANKLRTLSINQAAMSRRRQIALVIACVAGIALALLLISILSLALTGRVAEMLMIVAVVTITSLIYFIFKYFRDSLPIMGSR
jgi:hypothetical protein